MIEDASCEYSPYREVGRPRLKWDDILNRFCRIHFNLCWQEVSIGSFNGSLEQFVDFYNEGVHVDPPVVVVVDTTIVRRNIITPFVPFFHAYTDTWW